MASGIGIALMAFIWLGMSRFLEKGQYYAAYFDESVQGLDRDSPVKYRGVGIGRVQSIGVAPDSKLIQIVLKIESGQALDHSIVAQLKSVGITGSMFVELDRKRKGEADRSPRVSFPSKFPVVASKPSDISELFRGIDEVLKQMKSLDLQVISAKVKFTLDDIRQAITDVNVKGISASVQSSLADVGQILEAERWDGIISSVEEAGQSLNTLLDSADRSLLRLDNTLAGTERIVARKEETIQTAIENFGEAMKSARTLLEKGSSLVGGTHDAVFQLRGHLVVTSQNLQTASENLNRLLEILADQPSQLLFGEPPAPRRVESLESEAYEP